MCLDYRKLNADTTRDAQPFPRVDNILESLDEDAIGLTNEPGTFQPLMNMALQGLTWEYFLEYMDDILIWLLIWFSFDEHLYRLRVVFERLIFAGIKLKSKKCHFLKKCMNFRGLQ